MNKVKQYQEEMNRHIDEMVRKVEPLSEEMIRWKPSEDEWSIMEILCHVEEVIRYWVNELVRVIQAGGTEWGRGLQDEARLAAVRQADHRSIDDVMDGI
ncbi:DinB family protein [Anoxybacillus vitaminiphilus]|uniref:DinB family protein n=1 Tax=Paranoxybacillus vitaminiphilus TaxID=581036 RepID=A0A327XXJ5_9BACL|nr:DinB family protein [Anoxybacillus vitaminiphilus]RAK13344.1 DinB family protein [Anoxybacillus vitaminiphilus]